MVLRAVAEADGNRARQGACHPLNGFEDRTRLTRHIPPTGGKALSISDPRTSLPRDLPLVSPLYRGLRHHQWHHRYPCPVAHRRLPRPLRIWADPTKVGEAECSYDRIVNPTSLAHARRRRATLQFVITSIATPCLKRRAMESGS